MSTKDERGKISYPDRVGHEVRVAYKVVRRVFAQQLAAIGIPYAYYRCLRPLMEEDGITQVALSARSGIDAAAATDVIDRMEAEGLVRRERDAGDRRKRLVFITATGRKRCEPLHDTLAAMNDAFLEGIPPAEYRRFQTTLGRLIANSERLAERIAGSPSQSGAAGRRKVSAPTESAKVNT